MTLDTCFKVVHSRTHTHTAHTHTTHTHIANTHTFHYHSEQVQVNDKQPGARKSARRLILQLREAYIGTKIERKAEDWLEFVDVTLGKAACAKILGMK